MKIRSARYFSWVWYLIRKSQQQCFCLFWSTFSSVDSLTRRQDQVLCQFVGNMKGKKGLYCNDFSFGFFQATHDSRPSRCRPTAVIKSSKTCAASLFVKMWLFPFCQNPHQPSGMKLSIESCHLATRQVSVSSSFASTSSIFSVLSSSPDISGTILVVQKYRKTKNDSPTARF